MTRPTDREVLERLKDELAEEKRKEQTSKVLSWSQYLRKQAAANCRTH